MSFLLLVLYFFCTIIRPQDWVAGLYGRPLITYLTAGTIVCLLFEKLLTKRNPFLPIPQNRLMVFFFITILFSHISNTYFGGMIAAITDFKVIFILYLLVQNGVDSKFKMNFIYWFTVLMVVTLVYQGMYQMEHGYGWAGQDITHDRHRNEDRINWIGIFNDPNDLALLFVMVMGLILPFIFSNTNFLLRLMCMGSAGLLFYGIYLTNSRGGLLALLSTIFFFMVRKTKKFMLGGIIAGVIGAGVIAVGPSRVGIISSQEASAYSRIELWYQGILMLKSRPLFGRGYDMYMEALPQTAHNSFILAAAELGFIGLMLWMMLFYMSIKGLSQVQDKVKSLSNYALGLQASMVGFAAAAFFVSRTYTVLPYLLFALSGSVMYLAKLQDKELDYTVTSKDWKNGALLSAGVLIVAYVLIKVGI